MLHAPRSQIWRVALLATLLAGPIGALAENVLFEDDFNSGTWRPEWQSRMCCQQIREGWLHSMDTDGWPRDAMAVVHDGDQNWRDYTLSLKAQFAATTDPEHFNILLRTKDFVRSSELKSGTAYQVEFRGRGWCCGNGESHTVVLLRTDYTNTEPIEVPLASQPLVLPHEPALLDIALEGARILLRVNGNLVFDVVDPRPLLYGGIGVHTTWETEARFDDIIVTSLVSFSHLMANLSIKSGGDQTPDVNEFQVQGSFILGDSSNGIDPLTEAVTVQVGTSALTIPAGAFHRTAVGAFEFAGVVEGVTLQVMITPLTRATFEVVAHGEGAALSGIVVPVPVGLTLGDDRGNTTLPIAEISAQRPPPQR